MKNRNNRIAETLRLYASAVKFLILLIASAPFISSCKKENMGDCFKSTGDIAVEYRTVAAFDTIQSHDNISVYLTTDTFFEIKVEAGENLIPLIKTEVKNNKLIIKNDNTCNWVRSFTTPVNVHVTMPSPGGLINEATSAITSVNAIKDRTLLIKMTSSGDVDLKLDIPHLLGNLSACEGNLNLSGNCELFEVFFIGSSIIEASNLSVKKAYIQTSGTGDFHLNVSQEIGAKIDWVGNVYYTGNAVEAYANYTSSGRIIKI
ncbi:MAG: hypothetical protein POELPBGB_00257 [Bacteroidia bacterium]|nr:hypothetical protein [Bacteroidia bacterium]